MPNKHHEDGPISVEDARARANEILADPRSRGQSADHERSQREERLDDPKHQGKPDLNAAWRQVGDDWVHDVEG